VYDTIGDLFEGHPDLQAEFVNFLPKKMQSKMNGSRANRAAAAQHRLTPTNKPIDGSIDERNKAATSNPPGAATSADRPLESQGDRRPPDQSIVELKADPRPEPGRREEAPVRPCKPSSTSSTTSADVTSAADDTRDGSPSCATKLNDASASKHKDPVEDEVSAADRNETCSNGDSAVEHSDPGSKSNDGSPIQRSDPDTGGESAAEHCDLKHPSPTRPRPVPETSPKRQKTEPSTGNTE
jgi:hypothetical protein